MRRPFDLGKDFSLVNKILAKASHEAKENLILVIPEYKNCDHGVVFDEVAAKKILEETPADKTLDPAVAFIMGNVSATSKIRKLWPRLDGHCPEGCGFYGSAYASYAHYIYGDW